MPKFLPEIFLDFLDVSSGNHLENLEGSHPPWWTKTLRHIMWSLWWYAPWVPSGYAPRPTFVELGSLFMIFS